MLYSVRGKLIHTTASCAVVECGGVGFNCQTTLNTLRTLKLGSEVTLFTYMNVREDAIELFGFATKTELDTFKTLISVSGVGPKAGLSVLSELSPEQVAMAIATDDVKTITRAQNIDKKIAQRIVLELKDKLSKAAKSAREPQAPREETSPRRSRRLACWAIRPPTSAPRWQLSTAACPLSSLSRRH